MMILHAWHALTYLGDGSVLLPCAVLFFAWLVAVPATRRTGWLWLVAVLVVGGAVALSRVLYMISGLHPAGWNFTGLSGHSSLSFLFWPSAGALVTGRTRTVLRAAMIALGACLALAISVASFMTHDHSMSELVLGGVLGALIAAVFMALTWRHVPKAPVVRRWMVASVLLLGIIAYGHGFPSMRVLGWIALRVSGHTAIHTRCELGPQAQLSKDETDCADTGSPVSRARTSGAAPPDPVKPR